MNKRISQKSITGITTPQEVHHKMPCPKTPSMEGCNGCLWLITKIGNYDTPCLIQEPPRVRVSYLHEDGSPKTIEEFYDLIKESDTKELEDSLT